MNSKSNELPQSLACLWCNLGLIHGQQFDTVLRLVVYSLLFIKKAKQGRLLCAVSTYKSLPHQKNR